MSHTTTIGNFSVQSVEFSVPEGDTITSVNPTATLTLVPNPGYQIDANDFSYTSGPSQITNVVFTQSGDNVLCVVTFDASYVMPGNDIELPICIEGNATLLDYTLDGIINLRSSGNTTPVSGDTPFSSSGYDGEVVQAFSYTLSADAGYYFDVAPTGSITTGDPGNYSVITSNTYDAEGNLTAVTFTADYTFPPANVSGNVFSIVANAKQIPVPVYEITSYTISKNDLPGESATTRNMKIFGTVGAQFSLTVVNEDGTSVLSSPLNNIIIPAAGFYSFNITFPSVTDNDQYDFVLTGDGVVDNFDGTGQQPSIFTIYQYLEITVTFGINSANSQLNISQDIVYTYPPNKELDQNDSDYNFQATFTITSGSTISVISDPLTTDWPNLVGANNGGTDIQLSGCTGQLTDNDLTYTITVSGTTSETGLQDVLSEIDIDSFISTNSTPEALSIEKIIFEDEANPANLIITLLGSDADPGDTLTYEILTLPTNGDLYASTDTTFTTPLTVGTISGNQVLYKPDANYNGADAFNYNVTDGAATSSMATVLITVVPVNDAPVATPQAISLLKGAEKIITLAGYDIEGDPLSYIIDSLPANGTLYTDPAKTDPIVLGELPYILTSNVVYYEHDDSSNLTDAFNFKVNDGTVDSSAAAVTISVGVPVGSGISTRGSAGVYYIPITLGTAAGTFKVHFNAYGLPDRLRILFDTNGISNELSDMEVVADSLWVGDNLFELPGDNDAANGTYVNLGEYMYVGSGGDAPSSDFTTADDPTAAADQWDKTSSSATITISDDVVCNITSLRSGADTAISNGQSRGPATPGGSDYGYQIGAQNGVYEDESTTTLTTGLLHVNGNICLTYTKPATTSAFTAYLKIEGKGNTGWDVFQTEFV